ncbi:MAG TPA: Hpt domain-containing protein [Gammaproteobacteria bacterium]|nr:Hpt domain-containing protein [Gammaproteobacteria bacterium]
MTIDTTNPCLDIGQLTEIYRASFVDKHRELQILFENVQAAHWSASSLGELRHFIHKLSGSAAAYQFTAIANKADWLEQRLKATEPVGDWKESLTQGIMALSSLLLADLKDDK